MTPRSRSDSSSYVPVLCTLERKGVTIVILIHFESFINFATIGEFYVNLSFIGTGKAQPVCQSLAGPSRRGVEGVKGPGPGPRRGP